jgi:hypothetical protein
MGEKPEVLQGTLALMVLKTLDVLGPLHGYGIARRIEQISGDLLAVNQGTLYPLLLRKTIAGRASIALPGPAISCWSPRPETGNRQRRSLRDSSR